MSLVQPDRSEEERHETRGEDAHAYDPSSTDEQQTRPPDRLPDPVTLVSNLSLCIIEVLAGARDLNQLSRWLSDEVYRTLRARAMLTARARSATGRAVRRPQVRLGTPRISRPSDSVVEAVVVVHQRGRSRAVAMRLEVLGDRWRASAVNVL